MLTPKRKHCCFQFSLRTVLMSVSVLALPCAWLGSQVKIVRDRAGMIARVRSAGGDAMTADDFWILDVERTGDSSGSVAPGRPKPISSIRRWLGDDDFSFIGIPGGFSRSDEQKIREEFPGTVIGKARTGGAPLKITTAPCIVDLDNRLPFGK